FQNARDILRTQPVRDPPLVQISIANEGEQAAVLVLTAEASHPRLSRRFEDRRLHSLAMHPAVAQLRLFLRNREQGPVINRFYKSIPKSVQRGPQRADVLTRRDVLLGFRTDRAIVPDRSAGERAL